MNRLFFVVCIFAGMLFLSCNDANKIPVDLSGKWTFRIDPEDVGEKEEWYKTVLPDTITLPGSLQIQGFGDDITLQTKWTGQIIDTSWISNPVYTRYFEKNGPAVPFWLTPEKHYVGVAWYQKEVIIPEEWTKNKSVILTLERPHWETTLFVDGNKIGTQNAMGVPHYYELSGLTAGKHTISVRVDNHVVIPVGINAHSVSDHTQSNWNGIIGDISLSPRPQLYIDRVTIYPDVKNRKARVVIDVINTTGIAMSGDIHLKATPTNCLQTFIPTHDRDNCKFGTGVNKHEMILDMGENPSFWDEYTPDYYTLETVVKAGDYTDVQTDDFGLREYGIDGKRFTVNGKPVFLRGTLDCCIFPITGYPSMDEAYWEKIYKASKEHGLNHIRFHSWCPPKVAFEVADREGVYLQVECSAWTDVGSGTPYDKWVYEEGDRILKEYGNHPSFFALLHGNEPGGRNQVPFLKELVEYWRKTDGRHMYTGGANWPYIDNGDFYNTAAPRIQQWGAELNSLINAKAPETIFDFDEYVKQYNMPVVSHEIGQWCVYPNYGEIKKYTGFLKAKNFEMFKDELERNHLADMAGKFLMASGKLQVLCYKADIEAALRTPDFAGFQLLGLYDFSGQGTALVGVLDAFWESKGYVSPEEFRMFCNRTVPLARMSKLIWSNQETFHADIEVSHFDKDPVTDADINWSVADQSGKIYKAGSLRVDLPVTNCIKTGTIDFLLNEVTEAKQLSLTIEIPALEVSNNWNFWVYPEAVIATDDIYITDKWDAKTRDILKSGGKVLLSLKKHSIKKEKGGDIQVGFSSIFWNTAWTEGQAPVDLGIYCEPSHPALAHFPTSYHSDYQWWEIVSQANAVILDDFPQDYRPIVHFIDDWFTNRKLGLLFESEVEGGKLLICSADLHTNINSRLSARQLKYSLVEYMKSEAFNPTCSVTSDKIGGLIK
ncbi:MAG: beta-galactosidase [Tannerella sp.]|jgi:hypothetical protein|nr:beta-galactosidase [Tannerella sp.]